jgi:hypothetical protein
MTAFPFVLGSGRSGTTLLRAMLDSHPQLAIPGESWFLVELEPRFRRRWLRRFDCDAFASEILQHERFQNWGIPEGAVRAALGASAPATYPDAVRVLYRVYADHHGKARYGDKTPGHVLHIPLIAAMFPEALFVHIIRDGHDVALSLREIDEWGPRQVAGAAKYWVQHVEAGQAAGATLGASRYLEVRYEDLVADPEGVLRRTCAFIDLPYDATMLTYYERADEVMSAVALPHHHERIRKPPTAGLRSWQTEMAPDDVAAFEAIAGPLLAQLGYEVRTAS